ncbi:MAG TPA: helix-turn-helix domain-containing protein [bacterium]|nr:helix-turn-helix domain-containing protein [bacterium]
MAKEYMSVRELAAEAGVSVQAVYKWIEKGELKAEVAQLSKFEKRYHITRNAAERFLRSQHRLLKKSGLVGAKRHERPGPAAKRAKLPLTPKTLLESGLVGLWKDRDDIGDSIEFARKLRKRASTRHHD